MSDTTARPSRNDVVERYSSLARQALGGDMPRDCEPGGWDETSFGAAAYREDVPAVMLQASLGCGNPLVVAELRAGETVLDLGSGGGLDVLLSARRVGPAGKAIGLDASEDMLELARARTAGVPNVEFLHGHIENIPLLAGSVDVIVSNCVINLSVDKAAVFAEAARVLRPGGRLGISDITAEEGLDPVARRAAERLVGCSVGTLTEAEYTGLLTVAGFVDVAIARTAALGGGLHSMIVQARRP